MTYYLFINNSVVGPLTMEELRTYNVEPTTRVSADGVNYRPLSTYPELMAMFNFGGNPGYGPGYAGQAPNYAAGGYGPAPYNPDLSNKKLLCGLFGLLLPGWGIQYFLIGKVGAGVVTILLTLITCGVWALVSFIQGIIILTMSEQEFARKYVYSTSFMPLF